MERQTHINTRLTTVLVLYVCYKKICFNCLYMYEPLNTKHANENNGHLLHVFCIVCSWLLNLGLVLFSFIVPSMRISMPVVVWIFFFFSEKNDYSKFRVNFFAGNRSYLFTAHH